MSNKSDTISTDPELLALAKRVQNEEVAPIDYSPKAIFIEEYFKYVDPKYAIETMDETWSKLVRTNSGKPELTGPVIGTLREAEFRRMASSYCLGENAANLYRVADKNCIVGKSYKDATFAEIAERLDIDTSRRTMAFEPATGVIMDNTEQSLKALPENQLTALLKALVKK